MVSVLGQRRPVFQRFPKGIAFERFANPLPSFLPRKALRFAVNADSLFSHPANRIKVLLHNPIPQRAFEFPAFHTPKQKAPFGELAILAAANHRGVHVNQQTFHVLSPMLLSVAYPDSFGALQVEQSGGHNTGLLPFPGAAYALLGVAHVRAMSPTSSGATASRQPPEKPFRATEWQGDNPAFFGQWVWLFSPADDGALLQCVRPVGLLQGRESLQRA
jgi:hypothetical protein